MNPKPQIPLPPLPKPFNPDPFATHLSSVEYDKSLVVHGYIPQQISNSIRKRSSNLHISLSGVVPTANSLSTQRSRLKTGPQTHN